MNEINLSHGYVDGRTHLPILVLETYLLLDVRDRIASRERGVVRVVVLQDPLQEISQFLSISPNPQSRKHRRSKRITEVRDVWKDGKKR